MTISNSADVEPTHRGQKKGDMLMRSFEPSQSSVSIRRLNFLSLKNFYIRSISNIVRQLDISLF